MQIRWQPLWKSSILILQEGFQWDCLSKPSTQSISGHKNRTLHHFNPNQMVQCQVSALLSEEYQSLLWLIIWSPFHAHYIGQWDSCTRNEHRCWNAVYLKVLPAFLNSFSFSSVSLMHGFTKEVLTRFFLLTKTGIARSKIIFCGWYIWEGLWWLQGINKCNSSVLNMISREGG